MKIGSIISHPLFVVALTILTSGVWGIIWLFYLSSKLETYTALSGSRTFSVNRIGAIGMAHGVGMSVLFLVSQWFLIPSKLSTKRAYIGMKPKVAWYFGFLVVIPAFLTLLFHYVYEPMSNLRMNEIRNIRQIMLISTLVAEVIWLFVIQYFLIDFENEREMHREERAEKSRLNRERSRSGKPLPYMTGPYHKNEDLPPLELSDFESISEDDNLISDDDKIEKDDLWDDLESLNEEESGEFYEN